MADKKNIIEIIFSGIDDTTGIISSVGGKLQNLGESAIQTGAKIADFSLKTEAAISGLVVAGLTLATIKSTEYKDAVADLNKVMAEGESLTDDMKARQKELAFTYGIATTEIIASQAGLQQSGYNAANSLEILETSAKLAASSELSAAEATEYLKRTLIGYKLEAKDAIEVADLWNLTANKSSTDVRKLAEGFTIVARQAKDSGFTMEELSAALTPIIGVFASGSEAGNALSITLSSLQKPTGKAAEAIQKLLGTSKPLNEEYKTTADLFKAIAVAFETASDSEKTLITQLIVGKDQAKRATLAFSDFTKELNKVDAANRKIGESLENEVNIALQQTSIQFNRLSVATGDLFTTIGLQYDKEISKILSSTSNIFKGFEVAINQDAFKPFFDLIRNSGEELSKLLQDIATGLPDALEYVDFTNLIESVDELINKITGLFLGLNTEFESLDLSKPEDLAKVIQFAIDGIESLTNITIGIIDQFESVFNAIGEVISRTGEAGKESEIQIGKIIGAAKILVDFGYSLGAFLIIVKNTSNDMKSAFDIISGGFKVVVNSIQAFMDFIVARYLSFIDTILSGAELIGKLPGLDSFEQKIKAVRTSIGELKEASFYSFKENVNNAFEGAKQVVDGFSGSIKNVQNDIKETKFEKEIDIYWNDQEFNKILENAENEIKDKKIEANIGLNTESYEKALTDIGSVEKEFNLTLYTNEAEENLAKIETSFLDINSEISALNERKTQIQLELQLNKGKGGELTTPDEIVKELDGINKKLIDLENKKSSIQIDLEDARKNVSDFSNDLNKMNDIIVRDIEGEKYIEFVGEVKVDKVKTEKTIEELEASLPDAKILELRIKANAIELENKTKIAISSAEELTKRYQIKASLDIAQLESTTKQLIATMESVSKVFSESTDLVSDLFSLWDDDSSFQKRWAIQDQLKEENRIRNEQLEIIKKQAELQDRLAEAKLKLIESGKAGTIDITIDPSIEPYIDLVLRSIMSKAQAKINAEGLEALIGV